MNKKLLLGLVSISSALTLMVSVVTTLDGYNHNQAFYLGNAYNEYTTTLNSLNRINNGKIKTDAGNDVSVSYSGLSVGASGWYVMASNGYFTNTDAISGVASINYVGSGDLSISYGFDEDTYVVEEDTLSSGVMYYPSGYPSYFEISNPSNSGITIESIVFNYSCIPGVSPDSELHTSGDYSYVNLNNSEIKLVKYHGETLSFIEIPTELDDKDVVSIASGCFVNNNNNRNNLKPKANRLLENEEEVVDNEQSDYSTYFIPDSVDEIDNNAFDEKSSFVTNATEKKANWRDKALTGSAIDENGNVYYNTSISEVVTKGGINYVYAPNLRSYYLARCLTQRKEVVIPSMINGYPVADIGHNSFNDNRHIQKVTFPDTIGSIGIGAFYNCTNLREVIFNCPNLHRINSGAFSYCSSLVRVVLPENCTTLRNDAFGDCGVIEEFYLPGSINTVYPYAFNNTTVNRFYYAGTEELFNANVINDDNRWIFENASEVIFGMSNQDFVEVERLEDIHNIDNNTLVRCRGVVCGYDNHTDAKGYRTLMIMNPDTNFIMNCFVYNGIGFDDLNYIGLTVEVSGTKEVYTGEVELTGCVFNFLEEEKIEITPIELDYEDNNFDPYDYLGLYCSLDGTVLSVGANTIYFENIASIFGYCSFHRSVYPGPIVAGEHIKIYGWIVMYNQTIEMRFDVRTTDFYDRIEMDGYRYLEDGNLLVNVSPTYEGEFVVPNHITAIGTDAFRNCSNITSIVIPDTVTSLGNYAFIGCTSLRSVIISKNISLIDQNTFDLCYSLEDVYIRVNSISDYLNYTRYRIDANVHLIDASSGNEITSVTVPEGTTTISEFLFDHCRSITSLVIPSSVTSIGYSAFGNIGPIDVYYMGSESEWEQLPLYGLNGTVPTTYFYSESEPVEEGNYWHYVNDVPTVW